MAIESNVKKRVVVVGGGITGLSAAYRLARHCEVLLVEAGPFLGGKLKTATFRGRPLDTGPDVFITRNKAAEDLCREIGLGDELIAPDVVSAALLGRHGLFSFPQGLVLGIPTNPKALWRSPLLTKRAALRSLVDLVSPFAVAASQFGDSSVEGRDPSIGELIGSRLGRDVLEMLVDPLLGGINAGDSDELSFAAAAPQLAQVIGGKKSLMRALRPLVRPRETPPDAAPTFLGLERGIASLPERLLETCRGQGVAVRTSTPVDAIQAQRDSSGSTWKVQIAGEWIDADGLVLAVPAFVAQKLLDCVDKPLADLCGAIPFGGVTTVACAWRTATIADAISHALRNLERTPLQTASRPIGAGVLVPRPLGHHITAASFTSTKWPRSANADEVIVRASLGRYRDDRALRLDDEQLLRVVREELREILGIEEAPIEALITRWPDSFAQYNPGHLARVTRIEALTQQHGTLALAGASYRGIGIPACIESASRAAESLLRQLHTSPATSTT